MSWPRMAIEDIIKAIPKKQAGANFPARKLTLHIETFFILKIGCTPRKSSYIALNRFRFQEYLGNP